MHVSIIIKRHVWIYTYTDKHCIPAAMGHNYADVNAQHVLDFDGAILWENAKAIPRTNRDPARPGAYSLANGERSGLCII